MEGYTMSPIDGILDRVEKPSRYMGSELNTYGKAWDEASTRVVWAYPDLYEVGSSHLGLQILYNVVNQHPRALSERVYCPALDMEAVLREESLPLFSLESRRPLQDFDFVGITLQYELTYTNVLNLLDLGNIPLYAKDRDEDDPLVMAGGPCAFNVEPVADFFDLVVLGDGETVVLEIIEVYETWCRAGAPGGRSEILTRLGEITGVYIPGHYVPCYEGEHFRALVPKGEAPEVIHKRTVANLDGAPFPEAPIVPYVEAVHDRAVVELFRGCTRGCRFCMPGMVYRPVRERAPETVEDLAGCILSHTGYEELSLVSLSSSDYSEIEQVLDRLTTDYSDDYVSISLPSLRVDDYSVKLAERVREVRHTGLTLAPEAGTQRLRNVINKNVTDADFQSALKAAFSVGVESVKLYFMVGLPTEEDADLIGIFEMVRACQALYSEHATSRRPLKINLSVAGFIPKPHTPFQWERQLTCDELEERIQRLRDLLPRRGVKFSWHDPATTRLEGILARGDRRLAKVIEHAWAHGARFDGWSEFFDPGIWASAFEAKKVTPASYVRERSRGTPLPWRHLSPGISIDFLWRERLRAFDGLPTGDCRWASCSGCGVCLCSGEKSRGGGHE